MNQTFAMIKPCAFSRGEAENIKNDIRNAGFESQNSAVLSLEREQAEWLYDEHKEKSHFNDLVDFTISGPVEILILKSDSAETPKAFRSLMGPTDLSSAPEHTLRARYGEDFRRNAIHGSDGNESAEKELDYFSDCF